MAVTRFVPGASRVRRLRRLSTPRWSFVPWGLAPCAWLAGVLGFACGPFASGVIEASAQSSAQAALAEAGFGWASASADGQVVTLTGQPPDGRAAARALSVARAATAPTFAGSFVPAVVVLDRLDDPPPTWIDWTFRRDAGGTKLTGGAADADARARIAAAGGDRVEDSLLVLADLAGVVEPEGTTEVAVRAARALASCDRGEARFAAGVLDVRCDLPADRVDAVRAAFADALPAGKLGELSLVANEDIAACEAELEQVLASATIEFRSSSAEIPPSSSDLLDRVADVARACPGRLRVEGHTDSVGDPEYNMVLSQRRADAVRAALVERQIPPDRLIAEGFGDRRPKVAAGPRKAAARRAWAQARNRRIEIRVVRSVE